MLISFLNVQRFIRYHSSYKAIKIHKIDIWTGGIRQGKQTIHLSATGSMYSFDTYHV